MPCQAQIKPTHWPVAKTVIHHQTNANDYGGENGDADNDSDGVGKVGAVES